MIIKITTKKWSEILEVHRLNLYDFKFDRDDHFHRLKSVKDFSNNGGCRRGCQQDEMICHPSPV